MLLRENGTEATLAILGAGEVFGELGLFCDGTRAARIVALEESQIARIERPQFLSLVERAPALGVAMCQLLSARVVRMTEHFEAVTALTMQQRIARKLVFLAERWGEAGPRGTTIRLALSQTDLAELVEATRQSVNKCLREWTAQGTLLSSKGTIVIRDLARFRHFAARG